MWVGYTPERTVTVNGTKGFGGTVAAPIWARFMEKALADKQVRDFQWYPPPKFADTFNIPVSPETKSGKTQPVPKPSGTQGAQGATGGR